MIFSINQRRSLYSSALRQCACAYKTVVYCFPSTCLNLTTFRPPSIIHAGSKLRNHLQDKTCVNMTALKPEYLLKKLIFQTHVTNRCQLLHSVFRLYTITNFMNWLKTYHSQVPIHFIFTNQLSLLKLKLHEKFTYLLHFLTTKLLYLS